MYQPSPTPQMTMHNLGNIRHILVPLSEGKETVSLLKYATALAHDLNAKLTLLHVSPVGRMNTGIMLQCTHIQEEITWDQLLYRVRTWQIRHYPEVEYVFPDFRFEYGEIEASILAHAQELSVDMIVMGTGGLVSQVNKLFGSVAARIIRESSIPVWVVPTEAAYQPVQHIAYATQFESGERIKMEAVQDLARRLHATFQGIHIAGDRAEADLETELGEEQTFQWVDKSVEDGLLHVLNQYPVDLLVMATHSFTDQNHLLSHTREVMLHTTVPLLVLPHSLT